MNESDLADKENTHYLHPGNLFASSNPHVVTTILGSCIAVCLFDPTKKIGGINHYMLPLWNGEGLPIPRFGNVAIKKLIEKMEMLGANKRTLQAKVFGGSSIHKTASGLLNVGLRNIDIAKDMLEEERIPIIGSDMGGSRGRRVLFYTDTGSVKMRYIRKTKTLF